MGGRLLMYVWGLALTRADNTPLITPDAAAEPIHFKNSRRVDMKAELLDARLINE